MSYQFREAREKAGLSAVTQWETGAKVPSVEMLCMLADLCCVSTDYLPGRDKQVESIPCSDEILPPHAL